MFYDTMQGYMKEHMNMRCRGIAVSIALICLIFVPMAVLAADPIPGAGGLVPCAGPDCNFLDFITLIENVIDFLMTIAIPLSAILFSWAGFLYLTSSANPGDRGKAQKIFQNVFWGLTITFSAWLIVNLFTNFFLDTDVDEVFQKQGRIDSIHEII